jgi:hypothetical protein
MLKSKSLRKKRRKFKKRRLRSDMMKIKRRLKKQRNISNLRLRIKRRLRSGKRKMKRRRGRRRLRSFSRLKRTDWLTSLARSQRTESWFKIKRMRSSGRRKSSFHGLKMQWRDTSKTMGSKSKRQ